MYSTDFFVFSKCNKSPLQTILFFVQFIRTKKLKKDFCVFTSAHFVGHRFVSGVH
jgi:hypothetical protein